MKRTRRTPGVTLIELLIVISLMSIFAAALLPTTTPAIHDELDSAARRIASDIDYCRSLAVTNNSEYRIGFQVQQNRYVMQHVGDSNDLDDLPVTPYRNANDPDDQQIVDLDQLPLHAMRVELVAVLAGKTTTDRVEFGPLGETRETEDTIIWLGCGAGADRLYQAIRINSVTGLTWIEQAQRTTPVVSAS